MADSRQAPAGRLRRHHVPDAARCRPTSTSTSTSSTPSASVAVMPDGGSAVCSPAPADAAQDRPLVAPRARQIRSDLVGGDAPVTVQSMTITKTADVDGTLQQIYALAAAGADIVRCTCNEIEAAEGLAEIVPRSPVPIVADIHHQYKMALAALDAGVHCLRLNPGNIRRPEHIRTVAQEAKDRNVPIRIGVNGGSLDPKLYETSRRQGDTRGHGRVGAAGDGLLRRRRLRPHQDLGEGLIGTTDDRGLPAAERGHRSPTAPRRHRGRARRPQDW